MSAMGWVASVLTDSLFLGEARSLEARAAGGQDNLPASDRDRRRVHFGQDAETGGWTSHKAAGGLQREPRCAQGEKNLSQKLIRQAAHSTVT
jgi:hypothetical protein